MHLLLYEYCCVQSDADPAGLALLHEGWAMLRALVEDLARVGTYHLTVLASPSLERRLQSFPGVDVVPTQPENDLEMLATWATKVDACLVIAPEFRGLLLERVETVRRAGGEALNCSPESIRLTGDKSFLRAQLQCDSITTPPTELWPGELQRVTFPAVLKPVDGAGSQATYLVRDAEELYRCAALARAEGWYDLIVQPYLSGLACSVVILTGLSAQGRATYLLPPTEQLLSGDGRFHYRGARYPLAEDLFVRAWGLACSTAATLAGARGWIGLDLVLGAARDGSQDAVIEVNPRLTTSYLALRQRSRTNLADVLVRIALNQTTDPALDWDPAPLEFRLE